jgi:RNA polymerase sigma-70 factor, ECF subfamily
VSDEELMRAYTAGDFSAFEALYRRHEGRVYAYLRKRFQSAEEAEEAFQKVFLKLHQARKSYDPAYLFTQWLFVIARSVALDHLRKLGRAAPSASLEDFGDVFAAELSQTPGSPAYKGEEDLTILEDLPPEQRAALEMRVLEEKSYEEIARALNKSQPNVRQLVSRALRKLRKPS